MSEEIENRIEPPTESTPEVTETTPKEQPTEAATEKQLPIAYCGLYCGKCRNYVQKTCEGCTPNKNFKSCRIKKCCKSNDYRTCADCKLDGIDKCRKFNNFFSGVFSKMMGSDRKANIDFIRRNGLREYDKFMKVEGLMSFRKKR